MSSRRARRGEDPPAVGGQPARAQWRRCPTSSRLRRSFSVRPCDASLFQFRQLSHIHSRETIAAGLMQHVLKLSWRIVANAVGHFNADDGWAMASHVALSTLLALFPFIIFGTALSSFLGAREFADTARHLIFDTWPEVIAQPIASEAVRVMTEQHRGLLTRQRARRRLLRVERGGGAEGVPQPRLSRLGPARVVLVARAEPAVRPDRRLRLHGRRASSSCWCRSSSGWCSAGCRCSPR